MPMMKSDLAKALAKIAELEAENAALKHDITRQMAIANELAQWKEAAPQVIGELEADNQRLRDGIAAIKTVAESPFKDHWCIRMCEELLKEGGSE